MTTGPTPETDALLLADLDRAGGPDGIAPEHTTPVVTPADQLAALTAERDDFRNAARMYAATVDELSQHLDRANAHRDEQAQAISVYVGDVGRLLPVVEAAVGWAAVEAGRTSQTEHSSIWLEAAKERRAALLAAVDVYESRGEALDGQ